MSRLFILLFLLVTRLAVTAQSAPGSDIIFIDTHNDAMTNQVMNGANLAQDQPDYNFDLPKAKKGHMGGQVFSIWCDETLGIGKAYAAAIQEIDSLNALIARNPDKMMRVTNSRDLEKALQQKKLAAMMGVEGGHMIEERLDLLDSLINRGIKYLTLTWNNSTTWATSARDEVTKKDSLPHLGLNDMGKKIVARLNEAGVMVDVSHVGEQTFADVLAVTTRPVIASHSCAWSLNHHRRNLKDDQLKALAKNNGVVFVNFYSGFLDSTYDKKSTAFVAEHKAEFDSLAKLKGSPDLGLFQLYKNHVSEAEAIRPPLSSLIHNIDYMVKLIGVDHVVSGQTLTALNLFRYKWMM